MINVSIYDQPRTRFNVAIWNNADKTGKIVDAAGLIYNVGLKNLDPSVDGVLFPGETVEGILIDFETVVSVASITAPDPGERKEFEGGGTRGVGGSHTA